MMLRRLFTCFAFAAAGALALPMAVAEDVAAENSVWKMRKLKLTLGKGYTNQDGGQTYRGEYIYTMGPDQAGNIAMTCLNKGFMVVVATKDISIDENFREAWMYPKKVKRQPTVTINGEQIDPNGWIYLKKRGIAIPQSRKLSRKIYNGAIRGDKIFVDFDNKRSFELNLPKPNSDFAYFGAECGMGKNK